MNSEEFVLLQSKLGLNVIKTKNTGWVISQDKIAINSPSLESLNKKIKKDELKKIFSQGAKAVVFKTDDCNQANSAEYLFEGGSYSLNDFKSKIRNQIRKGLKSSEIKTANISDLMNYGLLINHEILNAQNRMVSYLMDENKWKHYVKTLLETKDAYCYGAYIENKMIGYVFFIKINSKYYIYHPYSTRKYSKYAPMNALLYTAINDFIKKEGEVTISYGLSSFYSKPSLDHFKKGMLFFEKATCRALVLPKLYGLLVNNMGLFFAKKLVNYNITKNKSIKYIAVHKACEIYKKL